MGWKGKEMIEVIANDVKIVYDEVDSLREAKEIIANRETRDLALSYVAVAFGSQVKIGLYKEKL